MSKQKTSLVWFKKDLRLYDHKPLHLATKDNTNILCFYVLESILLKQDSFDSAKTQFLYQSLLDLQNQLISKGSNLYLSSRTMIETLNYFHSIFDINAIYSHQESSQNIFYLRDKEVSTWCRNKAISFIEVPQFGVKRPNKNRDGWSRNWETFMKEPLIEEPKHIKSPKLLDWGNINLIKKNTQYLNKEIQQSSLNEATETLNSFLNVRSKHYTTFLSTPLGSDQFGSRLSPYISFGLLSMKHIVQSFKHKINDYKESQSIEDKKKRQGLNRTLERLHWHCHFIQKLEDFVHLDNQALSPSIEKNYNPMHSDSLFKAWCEGYTGFPMVDACMRFLLTKKWLNFRMRAMLISFASHQLQLDWRKTSKHLAKHFLDFEAGIHYSQIQMQSGLTGINAIRIYSPTKQAIDQDPDTTFIQKWVPELKGLPKEIILDIHQAKKQPTLKLSYSQLKHYQDSVVDEKTSYTQARIRAYNLKKMVSKDEREFLLKQHGSRRKTSNKRIKKT